MIVIANVMKQSRSLIPSPTSGRGAGVRVPHPQPFSRLLLFFFLSLFLHTPLFAAQDDTYAFTSAEATQRFQALTKEIRCVVCQNQSIAESNAPIAHDLRHKIHLLIVDNQSDQAIKAYLVKRYGEFILLRPPLHQGTALLWIFPLLIGVCAFWFLRKKIG